MKKIIVAMLLMISLIPVSAQNPGKTDFYSFTVKTIDGKDYPLSELRGKKVMVVNTASKCGLTPQYEQLQSLYEEYGGDDFVIVGFPANNFLSQEPGSNSEIKEFCQSRYSITFPMMEKISVKGDDMHPLYKWLTDKKLNNFADSEVKWNFQKYLINEKGELVSVVAPKESPRGDQVIQWLKERK
jgi:glutathione peroxidase